MKLSALLLAAAAGLAHAQARPQLDAAQAAQHEVQDYLAEGVVPWLPASSQTMMAAAPDFIVASDGSGSHRSVQAAVDAVPAAGSSSRRHVIHVRPGSYREPLCIAAKAPLLLRGIGANPAHVRIVEGRYNGLPKAVGTPAHPCVPALDAASHGTSGSTSVAVFSDDVQIASLTIANDAMDGLDAAQLAQRRSGAQAVALTAAGDRIQLEAVHLLGHQDTFYARRREHDRPARVFVRDSLIAGDVDFVFGNATLVITQSTLRSRSGRHAGGIVLAPSTLPHVARGFLVTHSRFVADDDIAGASVALGRAWDQGVPPGTWQPGSSPNGQALVRDSELGAHIAPWTASTSRRPFSASGEAAHRLAEFNNRQAAR